MYFFEMWGPFIPFILTGIATIGAGLLFQAMRAEAPTGDGIEGMAARPAFLYVSGLLGFASLALLFWESGNYGWPLASFLLIIAVALVNAFLCMTFSSRVRAKGEDDGKSIGFILGGAWLISVAAFML